MPRFNISKYSKDNDSYQHLQKMISVFHKGCTIKESETDIEIHSNSESDFIQHFNILHHKISKLDQRLDEIKAKLDSIIQSRLNNPIEIYYHTEITPEISRKDRLQIIQNTSEIYSYVYIHESYLLCILDKTTGFKSIIEFTPHKISDGWSPKFDINDGFYDIWYAESRKKELDILNQCYQTWSIEQELPLLHSLM